MYDTDTLALIIGDDGNSFARLSEYIKKSKIARQLRVIISNPLHKDLPKMPTDAKLAAGPYDLVC